MAFELGLGIQIYLEWERGNTTKDQGDFQGAFIGNNKIINLAVCKRVKSMSENKTNTY